MPSSPIRKATKSYRTSSSHTLNPRYVWHGISQTANHTTAYRSSQQRTPKHMDYSVVWDNGRALHLLHPTKTKTPWVTLLGQSKQQPLLTLSIPSFACLSLLSTHVRTLAGISKKSTHSAHPRMISSTQSRPPFSTDLAGFHTIRQWGLGKRKY